MIGSFASAISSASSRDCDSRFEADGSSSKDIRVSVAVRWCDSEDEILGNRPEHICRITLEVTLSIRAINRALNVPKARIILLLIIKRTFFIAIY